MLEEHFQLSVKDQFQQQWAEVLVVAQPVAPGQEALELGLTLTTHQRQLTQLELLKQVQLHLP